MSSMTVVRLTFHCCCNDSCVATPEVTCASSCKFEPSNWHKSLASRYNSQKYIYSVGITKNYRELYLQLRNIQECSQQSWNDKRSPTLFLNLIQTSLSSEALNFFPLQRVFHFSKAIFKICITMLNEGWM